MFKSIVISIFFICMILYAIINPTQPPYLQLIYFNLNPYQWLRSVAYSRAVNRECRLFSQRTRLLGPLERNIHTGELFFPDEKMALQDVHLLLRYSPRKADEGGEYLPLATSYLLSKNLEKLSIQQRMRTRITIFLSKEYNNDTYKRFEKWFESIYTPYVEATNIIRTTVGNQASWEYMINHTKHNKYIKLDTILFFLEDDYIYEATMLSDTIEFFASHNPCFVHPTDYPDRYHMKLNNDDGKITIVAGKTRLWRSITSTTVTYVCRWRTFLAFEDIIMQPRNDWGASNAIRKRAGNAVFFAAVPSHGAHTESLLLPKETKSLVKIATAAYHKNWWLFARRALLKAQQEKTFPATKLSENIIQ